MARTLVRRFIMARLLLIGAVAGLPLVLPVPSAGADWAEEFSAGNFLFRSEFPLADVQDLLDDIEQLQKDVEQTLGIECSDQEIQIHLFRTKYSYQRYLSVRVPQGAKRQAFYMPGTDAGRIYAYRHRGLETDVRHETTHALLRNALPFIPLWLDEGLAEYFEVPPEQRKPGGGHMADLRLAIRVRGWKPDLASLEAKRDFLEMRGPEYRDSWALIHFFLHGPEEARNVFLDYLHQIEGGEVPDPLSQSLRQSVPDYEREIIRHFVGPK